MYMSGNKFIIKQTPTTELLYINNVITQIYVIKRGITGNLVNYLKYFYTKYRKLKNTVVGLVTFWLGLVKILS